MNFDVLEMFLKLIQIERLSINSTPFSHGFGLVFSIRPFMGTPFDSAGRPDGFQAACPVAPLVGGS
jgi:hypothetical protein